MRCFVFDDSQSELYLCCLIAAKYGFLAKGVVLKSDRRIRRKYAFFPNHIFLFKTAANIKFLPWSSFHDLLESSICADKNGCAL